MVPTIIIENTKSRIVGLSEQEFFSLRETVIYFDKSGYVRASSWVKRNRRNSFKKYMIDTNGFFPTGLMRRVIDHLHNRRINFNSVDNRIIPKLNTEKYYMRCSEPTAYDDQTKCTVALLKAGQGIGQVPTGVGKTRIIKDVIQHAGLRTVVITPSTALKEQMTSYLEDCFGADNVGIYDKRFDNKPITVINYHSFGNTDPRQWEDYHLSASDEFHHGNNNTISSYNTSHLDSFYFRIGLTATNFTSSDDDAILLEAILSNTVFTMSIKEAILKKYIVPIMPIFFDIPNEHLMSLKEQGSDLTASAIFKKDYKTFIDENQLRNEIIIDTILKMEKKGIPVLALVKHIEHGKLIAESTNATFLNGQDKNAKENQELVSKFNELELSKIVGTSVIGEGVDTKACGAIFNGKGGKSKRELLQNIGRTVRKFMTKTIGFYFDTIDRRQKNLYEHSKIRMKIIEEEFGVKPEVIKV